MKRMARFPNKDLVLRASFPFGLAGVRATTMTVAEDSVMMGTELCKSMIGYSSCRTPVHVPAGDSDMLVSHLLHAAPMSQLLPDARLSILPGLGHMLHHFALDEVAGAVEEVAQRGKAAADGGAL